MANWFKIYETDLDETRLKYALNNISEVGWVWIGILSECCKHRSDTIRWGKDEVELFGFSDRLKVSIPKVNESILMLSKIEYIEILDGFIKVLKWNEKQSDYCVRRERGDYKKNPKYPRVSDNIGDSPREEKRVEEKREDKSMAARTYPSLDEVMTECQMRNFPEDQGEQFWNYYESSGWIDKNNKPVAKWRPKLAFWINDNKAKSAERKHFSKDPISETTEKPYVRPAHLQKQLDALRAEQDEKVRKFKESQVPA